MTISRAPNGCGSLVFLFLLLRHPPGSTLFPYTTLFRSISSLNNTDDGDLFWQGNQFGQGNGGYKDRKRTPLNASHRTISYAVFSSKPPVVTKYVDGIKQDDWTANQGLDNPRRALQPTAI